MAVGWFMDGISNSASWRELAGDERLRCKEGRGMGGIGCGHGWRLTMVLVVFTVEESFNRFGRIFERRLGEAFQRQEMVLSGLTWRACLVDWSGGFDWGSSSYVAYFLLLYFPNSPVCSLSSCCLNSPFELVCCYV